MKEEYAAHYVMYTHDFFLEDSIESVYPFVDKILVARTSKPWFGPPLPLEETERALAAVREKFGDKIEVYTQEFPDEQTQRNFLLKKAKEKGHKGAFIVDCDEVFIERAFLRLFGYVLTHYPRALRAPYLTFIKDASFCVSPPYETGLFYLDLKADPVFTWGRQCNLENTVLAVEEPEILHFSYLRKEDEDVLAKIRSFMHARDPVDWDGWCRRAYHQFHPRLKNFHPTHPPAWGGLMEFDPDRLPSRLRRKLSENKRLFHADRVRGKERLKLYLGGGGQLLEGYVNIDPESPKADLRAGLADLGYFEDNQADEVLFNAGFERLYASEREKALAEWHRVLKPGGSLEIRSIPDFDEVVKAYLSRAPGHRSETFDIDEVFAYTHGGRVLEGRIGQMPKELFNKEKLKRLLEGAGFDVTDLKNVCRGGEPNPVNLDATARKLLRTQGQTAASRYERASDLIRQERFEEAIAGLEEILNHDPNHAPAHNDLGALHYRKGEGMKALEHFTRAVQADPKNMDGLKNLADLSLELGHGEEAFQLYKQILAQHPDDPDALLGVGQVCLQRGEMEDAGFFFARVLEVDPANAAARERLRGMEPPGAEAPAPPEARTSPPAAASPEPKAGGPENPPREALAGKGAAEKKLVSIIIPTFNQVEYTKRCLESLFTHTSHPFELIVVDNGSADGTAEYLEGVREGRARVDGVRVKVGAEGKVEGWQRADGGAASPAQRPAEEWKGAETFPCRSIRIVRNSKNLGFPTGSNQGMALAQGEYLLLLNNDTAVGPGWLDRLVARAEKDEKTGLVGPVSNFAFGPQRVEEVGYNADSLEGLEAFSRKVARENEGKGQPFWSLSGFCLLIKKAVVEKIGGLDSRFGLGSFEDNDFCLRAGLAGFECWVALDCFVHHFGGRTFAGAGVDPDRILLKNWDLFKAKWSIPAHVAYRAPFDLSQAGKEGFDARRHYCPLEPAKQLLAKGEELLEQGQLEEARGVFEEVRRAAPEDPRVLNNLGSLAFREGSFEEAREFFRRVLEKDPNYQIQILKPGSPPKPALKSPTLAQGGEKINA